MRTYCEAHPFYYSTTGKQSWQFLEFIFDTLEEVRWCAQYYGVCLIVSYYTAPALQFGSNYR